MSYANIISFRVGDELHADLLALATARHMDVGKLLRSLVSRELHSRMRERRFSRKSVRR